MDITSWDWSPTFSWWATSSTWVVFAPLGPPLQATVRLLAVGACGVQGACQTHRLSFPIRLLKVQAWGLESRVRLSLGARAVVAVNVVLVRSRARGVDNPGFDASTVHAL